MSGVAREGLDTTVREEDWECEWKNEKAALKCKMGGLKTRREGRARLLIEYRVAAYARQRLRTGWTGWASV